MFNRIINFFLYYKSKFFQYLENIKYRKKFVNLNNSKLIFDIGSNLGEFSKSVLKYYPHLKIICIEANNNVLKKSYSHENINKLNFLVSNCNDKSTSFYIHQKFTGMSTASEEFINKSRFSLGSQEQVILDKSNYKEIIVHTISIDKLVNKFGLPDLIKIDVEGYELEVIKSMKSYSNKITFEWTEEFFDKLDDAIKYLHTLGYKEFGVVGYFNDKISSKFINSIKGDPFLIEPEYYSWDELNLKNYIDKDRRVNYGMIWAK